MAKARTVLPRVGNALHTPNKSQEKRGRAHVRRRLRCGRTRAEGRKSRGGDKIPEMPAWRNCPCSGKAGGKRPLSTIRPSRSVHCRHQRASAAYSSEATSYAAGTPSSVGIRSHVNHHTRQSSGFARSSFVLNQRPTSHDAAASDAANGHTSAAPRFTRCSTRNMFITNHDAQRSAINHNKTQPSHT